MWLKFIYMIMNSYKEFVKYVRHTFDFFMFIIFYAKTYDFMIWIRIVEFETILNGLYGNAECCA